MKAAELLKSQGAKEVHAYITHGVLSGPAVERIRHSSMKSLVITDSIEPTEAARKAKNIRIVPVAPLFAQAILNIANGTSVSSLFDAHTLEPIYEAFYPTAACVQRFHRRRQPWHPRSGRRTMRRRPPR